MSTFTKTLFDDCLGRDVQHKIHEFPRIAEPWKARFEDTFRGFSGDVMHVADVDVAAPRWLEHLADSSLKIRTLNVVRKRC